MYKYRNLIANTFLVLVLFIATFGIWDQMKDFLLGAAFGMSVVRLGESIAQLKQKKENEALHENAL